MNATSTLKRYYAVVEYGCTISRFVVFARTTDEAMDEAIRGCGVKYSWVDRATVTPCQEEAQ